MEHRGDVGVVIEGGISESRVNCPTIPARGPGLAEGCQVQHRGFGSSGLRIKIGVARTRPRSLDERLPCGLNRSCGLAVKA